MLLESRRLLIDLGTDPIQIGLALRQFPGRQLLGALQGIFGRNEGLLALGCVTLGCAQLAPQGGDLLGGFGDATRSIKVNESTP